MSRIPAVFLNTVNIAVLILIIVDIITKIKDFKTRLRLMDEDKVFIWCETYREERIKYDNGKSTEGALRTIKMMLHSVLCEEFDSEYFLDIEDVFEEFTREE